LRGLALGMTGMEEYQIASGLLRKIERFRQGEAEIRRLEEALTRESDIFQAEGIKMKLALLYLHSYSMDRAMEIFRELEGSTEKSIRTKAKFYLGWIYKLQAQYDQGAQMLLQLEDEEGLDDEMQRGRDAQLADIYYQQQDAGSAARYYEKLAHDAEGGAGDSLAATETWKLLADAELASLYFYDLDDEEKAKKYLDRIRQKIPHYADYMDLRSGREEVMAKDLRGLAFEQLKKKRYHKAWDLFRKNLKQHPEDAWTHSGLATTYALLSDLYLAREHALQGAELQSDEYTQSVMGYVWDESHEEDKAVQMYETGMRIAEEKGTPYLPAQYNLSVLYLKSGRYQEGLKLLIDADRSFSGMNEEIQAKILNNMGYALWYLGRPEQTRGYFEEALNALPEFTDAAKNISLISSGEAPQMSE